MLRKIVAIRNVGKFRKCNAAGDVQFRRATLIYAPNGRGKTTFCDICRSLKTGDADVLKGRATLGEGAPPEVEILLESGMVRFGDGSWSGTLPGLEVYDSRFIYENVYAGESVEHEQRRNLYNVIIGEQGVALRRKVDDLDEECRQAGRVVTEKENEVRVLIPADFAIERFLALNDDPDIDAKIADATRKIAALKKATEVTEKPVLSKVLLPAFPAGLEALLAKSLDDVSENAGESIRTHMSLRMQRADEPWLVHGLELVRGEDCPFCAQSLSGSEILAAYRTHFSEKYQQLKTDIQQLVTQVQDFAEEGTVLALQRATSENARLLVEWNEYISVPDEPAFDIAKVHAALSGLRDAALAVLERKTKSPLESFEVGAEFETAVLSSAEATKLAAVYNGTVDFINGLIRAKKEETEGGDLQKARHELGELEAIRVRHQDKAKISCQEFGASRARRKQLELEKQKARDELGEYSRDIFQRYQGRINRLLENFGATFHIERSGEQYKGGKPSSTYCLVIEGEEVELGDTTTPLSSPSFKNTLSAGDKSALALAFFLANLDQTVDLAQKVVVLDDPFTSQDASRQVCTQQEIRRLSKETAQIIVLSHDRRFLKRVWDGLEAGATKTLQFSELGDTTVTEWDIESVQDEYAQTYTTLWRYCNRSEGDPKLVVRTIRPLLEGYLRMKLPNEFDPTKWLGDYVKQIQDADPTSAVGQAKGVLDELEDLKEYAKRHHHPAGAEAPDEPVDAQEVLAFGKRALKLVQSF